MRIENPLARFSVEPSKESQRLTRLNPEEQVHELLQNFRGYENEVLKDSSVSIVYSYWFDKFGDAFTHPSKKDVHRFKDQFDPQERGVFPLEGFKRVTQLLHQDPGKVILWYSPKGPAAFDDEASNPYKDINFIYGQLYLQYYDEVQDKADAVAIKVTDEGTLKNLMPGIYKSAEKHSDTTDFKARIATYLLNPVNTGLTIDEFIEKDWRIGNIYTDKSGVDHHFDAVLDQLREKFINKSEVISRDARRFALKLANLPPTEQNILRTYLEFIKSHQIATGEQITNLMGACGGRPISAFEINDLLGITNALSNIYSSNFRLFTQTPTPKSEKSWDYHDGECVVCNQKSQVGPCNICKTCETKFDEDENFQKAA